MLAGARKAVHSLLCAELPPLNCPQGGPLLIESYLLHWRSVSARSHRPATSRGSAIFFVSTMLAGGLLCLPFMGELGLLMGALGGLCVAMVADTVIRARKNRHFNLGKAVDLSALDPQQKLAVLGQGIMAGSDFRSDVLRGVDKAEALANDDLEGALGLARDLSQRYPRSPAAWALRARLARRGEQAIEARDAASSALEQATRGGMNQMAVEIFSETPEADRSELALSRAAWAQLARALDAQEKPDLALFARGQEEAVNSEDDKARTQQAMADAAAALRLAGEERAADATDALALSKERA